MNTNRKAIVHFDSAHVDKINDGCSFWVRSMILPTLCIVFLLTGCLKENYGRIVFTHGASVYGDIYIMDWDGGNWTKLTNSGLDAYPKWSPEKDQIVFNRLVVTAPNNYFNIYKINPDGTNEELLIGSSSNDLNPAWSPDGNKLAFLTDRGGRSEIWIYDLRSGSEEKLDIFTAVTPVMGFGATLTWSPDGNKIAFQGIWDPNPEEAPALGIWTVGYPSGGLELLAESGGQPNWSKKSNKIVYSDLNIKVMNGDGTNKRTVYGTEGGRFPAWSVDFDEIVYQSPRYETYIYYGTELYRVQEDGTLLIQLTDNDTGEMYPHF
jgi:Tol biopolymer transport system component